MRYIDNPMTLSKYIRNGFLGFLVGLLVLPFITIITGWLMAGLDIINQPPQVAYARLILGAIGALVGVIAAVDQPNDRYLHNN